MRGYLRYRCRMCGTDYSDREVPDIARALTIIAHEARFTAPEEWARNLPGLVDVHACSPNELGIADLRSAYRA